MGFRDVKRGPAVSIRLGQMDERVHHPDRAIKPVVLKILGENFRESVVFRVCPEMRVEPAQLVGSIAANGSSQDRLIWVENRELLQELFRFPESFGLL